MKWNETTASKCRYGHVAERIFGDAEIIWESAEDNYQGHANVFARLADGQFAHYEWTYGSCSGCDEWESRNLSDDDIEAEMRRAMATFADADTVRRYLKLDGEFKEATVPSANSSTNGSIPGMLRFLGGGIASDFKAIGEAFTQWSAAK